jgi:DNA adenine methylase
VTILQRDGFEILSRIEDEEKAVLYVDPPYIGHEGDYIHKIKPEDHSRLATLLHRFKKARIVLSYYDHPKLSELYPDWYQEKIEVSKALSHQGRRGENDVKAVEVLLCNQPIEARKGQMSLFEGNLCGP